MGIRWVDMEFLFWVASKVLMSISVFVLSTWATGRLPLDL